MKIDTFGYLLFLLFAISSLNDAWGYRDDLFDIDDDDFNTLGGFDEDFDALSEFEVNKKPRQCRIKNDHYPNARCRKDSCMAVCKRELGTTEAKCRKSKSDKLKKCYCYKDCDEQGKPGNHATPPSSPPAVSPAPHASPVYPPSGSPSPTPTPVASPIYSPAQSPAPVASPAYPPSSPAPEPATPLDPPCDDSDDVPPPPKKPSSVGEFSDEDFDFIFS